MMSRSLCDRFDHLTLLGLGRPRPDEEFIRRFIRRRLLTQPGWVSDTRTLFTTDADYSLGNSHGSYAGLSGVVEANPNVILPPCEELVIDARVAVFATVVICRYVSRFAVNLLK